MASVADGAADEKTCSHWNPRKKCFCRMKRWGGGEYCIHHTPKELTTRRSFCSVCNSYVLSAKWTGHSRKCQAAVVAKKKALEDLPYYRKGVNLGDSSSESNCDMGDSSLRASLHDHELHKRISVAYETVGEIPLVQLAPSITKVVPDIPHRRAGRRGRARHEVQQESICGHLACR
jgi:hypothetical protein